MDFYRINVLFVVLVNYALLQKIVIANQCNARTYVNLPFSSRGVPNCQQNRPEHVIRGWAASRDARWEIKNDGKQLLIKSVPENSLWMTFRRSKTKHFVDYMKLKFGRNASEGSDHALDHTFQAGELQVFFKPVAGSQQSHVFSFVIEERLYQPNTEWDFLLGSILSVKKPGTKTTLSAPRLGVRSLLMDSVSGSIHTPRYIEGASYRYTRMFHDLNCNKRNTIWTVFPRPITLSFSQFHHLRRAKFINNHQEVQPSTFEPKIGNLCYIGA